MPWHSYQLDLETDDGPRTILWYAPHPVIAAEAVEKKLLPAFGGRIVRTRQYVNPADDPEDDDSDDVRRTQGGY